MFACFRVPTLSALLVSFALAGCVTPGRPDLGKGIDPQKGYVIIGKEVRVEGLKDYLEIVDRELYFGASKLIVGLDEGPEMIFRKYDLTTGSVPRGEPAEDAKDAFRFDFPVQPVVDFNNPSSAFNVFGTMGFSLLNASEYNRYVEPPAKTDTGYVVYETFEVEPGPYVFERYVYKTHEFYGNTHKITRHHVMQIKDRKIHKNSRVVDVGRGEVVYIGDVMMSFGIASEKHETVEFDKDMPNYPRNVTRYKFRATKWKVSFESDDERIANMRARMSSQAGRSAIVVRPLTRKDGSGPERSGSPVF